MNEKVNPPAAPVPGPAGAPGPEPPSEKKKRFGYQLRQKSVDALASEFRKLALLAGTGAGYFGRFDAFWMTALSTVSVWIAIQLVAIAIERIQVYPPNQGSKGDNP